MYACRYVCTWGSLRRRELSVRLSLSPGRNLSLEEDSQAAAGSWRGSAIPSSVTRQHYQRCCTCAPDINYHFLLAVYIFIDAFHFRSVRQSWVKDFHWKDVCTHKLTCPVGTTCPGAGQVEDPCAPAQLQPHWMWPQPWCGW